MTKRKAVEVLIKAAARFAEGSGVGLRKIASDRERSEIVQAIIKLWPYNFECSHTQLCNMGLYVSESEFHHSHGQQPEGTT